LNDIIKSLQSHRSVRSYQDKLVKEEELNEIIKSIQAAPNWINGQQMSIVAVKDPERKRKLAGLCGNQKHIEEAPVFLVFCADFYRTYLASQMENKPMEAIHDIDTLIVGVTDVGIALGTAVAAAESFGLGTVAIGGIRRNTLKVIEELNLPPYVIPVSGLCLGYPADDPGIKPRLPKEAVYFEETYQQDLTNLLEEYNGTFSNYLKERAQNNRAGTWTEMVANFYSKPHYYEGIAEMLKTQKYPGGNE
jgi:FMN reductase [NAD(P)H]